MANSVKRREGEIKEEEERKKKEEEKFNKSRGMDFTYVWIMYRLLVWKSHFAKVVKENSYYKYCKTRENFNFLKNFETVISVKIRNYSRSRITKRTSPLESSREI